MNKGAWLTTKQIGSLIGISHNSVGHTLVKMLRIGEIRKCSVRTHSRGGFVYLYRLN